MTIAITQGLELTLYLNDRLRLIGKDLHSGSLSPEQQDTLLEKSVELYGENLAGYDTFTFYLTQKTDNTFLVSVECYRNGDEDPADEVEGTLTL